MATQTAPTTHDALTEAGEHYAQLAEETEAARLVLVRLGKEELARGTSEVQVARLARVSRKTVRGWAGKSPRR